MHKVADFNMMCPEVFEPGYVVCVSAGFEVWPLEDYELQAVHFVNVEGAGVEVFKVDPACVGRKHREVSAPELG